jgi:hypothetical protein
MDRLVASSNTTNGLVASSNTNGGKLAYGKKALCSSYLLVGRALGSNAPNILGVRWG